MLKLLEDIIGVDSLKNVLDYTPKIDKSLLSLPGVDFIDRTYLNSDRNPNVLKNLGHLFNSGRLSGTGYLSILPLDHGIEHGAAVSFSSNIGMFDPVNIFELALKTEVSAVASSLGNLGSVCRKYVHKIPIILKVNHNDIFSNESPKQSFFAEIDQAFDMGASGVAATLYLGANDTKDQISRVSKCFKYAHEKGMFTIVWAYLRNESFKRERDYHSAADMTAQANYLASAIEADIVKQKFPTVPEGFQDINPKMKDSTYLTDHPVDMLRFQLLGCLSGRVPLLSSGGASHGNDLKDLALTCLVNKAAGGSGVIPGRKIFRKNLDESVKLMNLVHDIYLSKDIGVL